MQLIGPEGMTGLGYICSGLVIAVPLALLGMFKASPPGRFYDHRATAQNRRNLLGGTGMIVLAGIVLLLFLCAAMGII